MMQIAINIMFGVMIILIILWRLIHCFDAHTRLERISLALVGAGMILVTPAIWLQHTPFDVWSFNMSRGAMALLLYAMFIDRPIRAKRDELRRYKREAE